MPAKEDTDDILVCRRFSVEMPSCANSAKLVTACEIDDVELEILDCTQSNDVEWRSKTYGMPRFGRVRFWVQASDKQGNKDIEDWLKATGAGDKGKMRQAISVNLLKNDGSPGRRYNLINCFPVSFDAGTYDNDPNTNVGILECQIERIELT